MFRVANRTSLVTTPVVLRRLAIPGHSVCLAMLAVHGFDNKAASWPHPSTPPTRQA